MNSLIAGAEQENRGVASDTPAASRLSIIGADYMQIDALAKRLHAVARREHDHTDLRDTADMRGREFEVLLDNGRVARVTVELDRVEFPR